MIADVNRASFCATIPTTDLAKARRFYEDVLGLDVAREHPAGVAFRTGQTYLELYPARAAGTAQHTLGSFEVDDIETAVAALRDRGVTFEEYDLPQLKTVNGIAELPGGVKVAWFKDPEGNILGIVQPNLRSRLTTFPPS
jgi:catechol 2,3-dioxygenase-like lactoylglutathione lyase family enzyme